MAKGYSLEFKRVVVDEYKSNRYTVGQIASKHNISTDAVYKWVREDSKGELHEPIEYPIPRERKLSKGQVESIIKEYTEDKIGTRRLADKYDVTASSIVYVLKRAGVYEGEERVANRKSKISSVDVTDIITMYNSTGMNVKDIADVYKVTPHHIRKIMRDNGVDKVVKHRSVDATASKYVLKDKVIAEYSTGVFTHHDLAEKYKVSTRTISRILKEAGIEAVKVKPSVPVTKVLEIKEGVMQDIDSGLDVYALAEKYGVKIGVIESITSGAKTSESTGDCKAEQIMTGYNNGLSIKDIVQECGVALSTVYRVLKLNGVNIKEKRADTQQVDEVTEDVSRIAELHSQGLTLKDIAKEADMSVYLVKKILEELGLEQNNPSDKHRPCVVELCRQGMSVDSIASQVGLSVPTVRKILHEEGLTPSKGDNEVKKRVLELFNQGMKAPQIASECGISAPTVRKIIVTSGQVKDLNERIVELYDGGMEIEQIAQEVGLNRPLVMIELSKAMKAGTLYRPFFPESDISVIKHLASKWTTPDKISSHLGCDENYIRRFLQLPDKKI